MAKVSKNARTNRAMFSGGKDMVRVVVSVKSEKTGAWVYREKMVHKDKVKEEIENMKS